MHCREHSLGDRDPADSVRRTSGSRVPGLNVVVIGDIGWPHLYHVGDEAMTEAALAELKRRGVVDITLIAADPDVAKYLHGTHAVPRFHFKLRWPRPWQDSHLRKVLAPLRSYTRGPGPALTVYDAVHDADAVIIAGGGNLTSTYVHQLYERLALVRVAKHFNKPVYATSQTIGSTFRPADVPVIAEILQSVEVFGAREQYTYDRCMALNGATTRVQLTGDGAFMERLDDSRKLAHSMVAINVLAVYGLVAHGLRSTE